MKKIIVTGLLIGCVYSLLLNAHALVHVSKGTLSPVDLGIAVESADEAHYFALAQKLAQGHWSLGSASLKEHQSDAGNVIFGPLPQAMLMRFSGWSVTTVALIGDIVFPILAALVLFLICTSFFKNRWQSALVTVTVMNAIGLGWQRSVNPQITVLLFLCFVLLLLQVNRNRWILMTRGLLIGIFLFVQIHFALFCVLTEALIAGMRLLRKEKFQRIAQDTGWILIGFAPFFALEIVVLLQSHDAMAIADFRRRMGVIPSHLPANPVLQLQLLIALAALAWMQRRKKMERSIEILISLLVTGLIVLNQSVIHGIDAIFGLYYSGILHLILWLSAGVIIVRLSKIPVIATCVITLAMLLSLQPIVREAFSSQLQVETNRAAFDASKKMEVIEYLKTLSGEQVIAAPLPLADIIPTFTKHFVLFNHYSRFGLGPDKEIAERYLTEKTLFGAPTIDMQDTTYGIMQGQYAGNVAGRHNFFCRIRSALLRRTPDCLTTLREQIFHQDLIPLLDSGTIDPIAMIRKYHVDILVSDLPLSPDVQKECPLRKTIGTYAIRTCSLDY